MITDSLVLGTTPNNLTFVKKSEQFGSSTFAVQGLTANAARTFGIRNEVQKNGRTRTQVRLGEVDLISGTTSGQTEKSELYIVIDRAPGKTSADMKAMFARLKTIVDSTALQDQLLNGEV